MTTIVNAVINQVMAFFTNGFLSGIEGSEVWLFARLDGLLLHGSQSPVSSAWFYLFFQKMELLSLALVLPLFLFGVISSVFFGSGSYLFRLIGVYLPISLVGSGLFLFFFQTAATSIDAMAGWLMSSEHVSLGSFSSFLALVSVHGDSSNPIPFLIIGIAGVVSLCGALSLYFELLLRQGVMLVLGAFIPFALLFVLLSSSRVVLSRYIEVTVGVLFSKLAVVVLLCLGGGLVGHAGSQGDFGQFMTGIAMIILAAFSPFLLFSLIPIAHLDHQSQLSHLARRSAGGVIRKGGMLAGGPSVQATSEIPMATATVVPSYLKQSH